MNYTIYNDNCLIQLKELEDNSIDSIVTDPPYEISFMSKGWDGTGIAFNIEKEEEYFEIAKARIDWEKNKNNHTKFFE